jgi:hypothetical protein
MITLYHGSNVPIDRIDLSRSKVGKDFGKGFYLNANREQAFEMAVRTTQRLQVGEPVVNAYSFDDSILVSPNDVNVKIFDDYTEEWAEFVLMNRKNRSNIPAHPYDIVVGPIADDTVGLQIYRFSMGYIEMKTLISELRFHGNHATQYFFGTEKAINLLHKMNL